MRWNVQIPPARQAISVGERPHTCRRSVPAARRARGPPTRQRVEVLWYLPGYEIIILSISYINVLVNIRLSHSAHRKKRNFLQKADITLAYGKASATTHLHCGVCTGKRRDDHAFLPTVSGADKARLYRTQVGSELLAGPTRTPGATRSGIESANRSPLSADTRSHPT